MSDVTKFRIVEDKEFHTLYLHTFNGWEPVFRASTILVGECQVRSLLNSYLDSVK